MSVDPFQKKQLNYKSYVNVLRALSDKPLAQTSTALILTLITIAFFGFAAVRPTLGTVTELQKELKEKSETVELAKAKQNQMIQLSGIYNQNKEIIENFDLLIPESQDIEGLLMRIEYVAFENQTPLRNVRMSEVVSFGDYSSHFGKDSPIPFPSILLSLSARGSRSQLLSLVDSYKNLDRYLHIESISFSKPNEEEITDQEDVVLDVRYFWAPLDQKPREQGSNR